MQIRSKLLHLHAAFVYSFDFEVEKLGSHKAKRDAEVNNLEMQKQRKEQEKKSLEDEVNIVKSYTDELNAEVSSRRGLFGGCSLCFCFVVKP